MLYNNFFNITYFRVECQYGGRDFLHSADEKYFGNTGIKKGKTLFFIVFYIKIVSS